MKYKVFIFNPDNEHPIGEVSGSSIKEVKARAREYASEFNGKGGRIIIKDQKTGKTWGLNS